MIPPAWRPSSFMSDPLVQLYPSQFLGIQFLISFAEVVFSFLAGTRRRQRKVNRNRKSNLIVGWL